MKSLNKAKAAIFLAGLMAFANPLLAKDTYVSDKGHTEVLFSWSHAGVSIQSGEFTQVEGTLLLDQDDIANSEVDVVIDVNSIATGVTALDSHLKSLEYFAASQHPKINFKSTKVEQTGPTTADVTGDLTIRDVTKSVTLKTELTFQGEHPVGAYIYEYRGNWVAFRATTEIDHMDFGVGSFSTGPISITLVTEMKQQK